MRAPSAPRESSSAPPTAAATCSGRVRRVGALVALVVGAVAGFAASPASADDQAVEVVDTAFEAPAVAVRPGETVTWNHPQTADVHNVAFDDGAPPGFPSPPTPMSTPWTATRKFDNAGTYRYHCQEHGGLNRQGMSGVVYVREDGTVPGVAPSASFTVAPGTASVDQDVNFDAGGTTDADDDIVRHEWDLDDNGTYEIDSGERKSTSRRYQSPGALTIGLRVTDHVGHTHTTTRSLTVTSPPSAALAVSPSVAQTGQTVTFNGGDSRDPDGTIAKYQWDLDGDGTFETDTGTSATTSRSYAAPGTLTVRLRVTDDVGVTGETTQPLAVEAPAQGPPGEPPSTNSPDHGSEAATPTSCSRLTGAKRTACLQKSCRGLRRSRRAACIRKSCRYLKRSRRSACARKSCRFLGGSKKKSCVRKHRRRERR